MFLGYNKRMKNEKGRMKNEIGKIQVYGLRKG
jgi:hypothetical protein